jgi:hypothetical protein
VCGHNTLEGTHKEHRDGGGMTVVWGCWNCHERTAEIARACGIGMVRLLRWPPPEELGPQVDRGRGRAVWSGPAISDALIVGCASALRTTPHALAYLRETRGLTDATIRRYELGYIGKDDAILIPVRDEDGKPVAIKRRFLDPAANPKTANSPGAVHLYPDLPKRGRLLFVAGEIDVLTARQMDIPAITSTGGWLARDQVALLANRQIVLLPDVGEELAAEHQAAWLSEVGCDVLIVHWPPGMPDKTDLNDWVVKYGGTRKELFELIREQEA